MVDRLKRAIWGNYECFFYFYEANTYRKLYVQKTGSECAPIGTNGVSLIASGHLQHNIL